MFLIRQSALEDLDDLADVAEHLDTYNLPADRSLLREILEKSSAAFGGQVDRQDREFLFVLEDTTSGRVIGTSMIHAQHGTRRSPHVYLRVGNEEHYSETLDRYMVHQILQIGYNYDGPTEIGGLILHPQFRGHPERLGKLLSLVRFVYIAMHRDIFRDEIISELLPPLDDDGTSKLWKHLGRRFTDLSYQEADRISKHNKEFIKSLFPHTVIYTALLPEDVRTDIGKVGKQTQGVKAILKRIGFRYSSSVDPFDGGPHFSARTDDVSIVRDARKLVASAGTVESGSWTIIARADAPFRATAIEGTIDDDRVIVPPAALTTLGVAEGTHIWAVTQ